MNTLIPSYRTSSVFSSPVGEKLERRKLLVIATDRCYHFFRRDTQQLLEIIEKTASPLKRQLLMVALITRLLEQKGKPAPILIGGCPLSYYSREVYFTADIKLGLCRQRSPRFRFKEHQLQKAGRYWVNEGLKTSS